MTHDRILLLAAESYTHIEALKGTWCSWLSHPLSIRRTAGGAGFNSQCVHPFAPPLVVIHWTLAGVVTLEARMKGPLLQLRIRRMRSCKSLSSAPPIAAADRKSTRLNSSHSGESRMPSSA